MLRRLRIVGAVLLFGKTFGSNEKAGLDGSGQALCDCAKGSFQNRVVAANTIFSLRTHAFLIKPRGLEAFPAGSLTARIVPAEAAAAVTFANLGLRISLAQVCFRLTVHRARLASNMKAGLFACYEKVMDEDRI